MDYPQRTHVRSASDELTTLSNLVPMQTFALEIGRRTWQITAACDQDPLLDFADALENVPYGFLLWESALGLARHLVAIPKKCAARRSWSWAPASG
ncbi:MAG: hypothetical protein HC802_17425 [Caldilineaceae bacterium]|nr:hypothetical protein [Caldilineaceae bacterium]